jgi:hypothetical protein
MTKGRVQVKDLEDPEKLVVAPVQSSTYAPAGPVPDVSSGYEKLASALGQFGSQVNRMAAQQKAEDEKKAKEAAMLKGQHYLASTSNPEQVKAIHAGELPYWHDPLIAKVVQSHWGSKAAEAVAEQYDRDVSSGALRVGDDSAYNVDKYLAEKGKQYIERVGTSPYAMDSFNRGMEAVRGRLIRDHQKVRSEAFKTAQLNDYGDKLTAALDRAAVTGTAQDAESTVKTIRSLQHGYGPRENGGVVGFSYKDLDKHTLKVLKLRAEDPNSHAVIDSILKSDREDLDALGKKIPALDKTADYADEVKAIRETMRVSAVRAIKDHVDKTIREQATEAFLRGDQSIKDATDQRIAIPGARPGDDFTKPASKIVEEGTLGAMERIRKENPADKAFDLEAVLFSKNNVKHPQWFGRLEAGRMAAGSGTAGQPLAPDQLEAIEEGARLYNSVAARAGHPYVEKYTDPKTRSFYEGYNTLRQTVGLSPTQAAATLLRAEEAGAKNPQALGVAREKINSHVTRLSDNPGLFTGNVLNTQRIRKEVSDLAEIYVRARGLDPKVAVDEAAAVIESRGFYHNDQFIVGVPGVSKDDKPVFDKILKKQFDRYSKFLANDGVSSADDLAIGTNEKGELTVIKRATGIPVTVLVPRDAEGNDLDETFIMINPRQFARERQDYLDETRSKLPKPGTPQFENQKTQAARRSIWLNQQNWTNK